ncbi:MAG: fibronectin type III domain-containing protein [Kofleriaceae bacterium]
MKFVVGLAMLAGGVASADDKRCLDVQWMPSDREQLVAWVTQADGTYIDTIYITQQTGTFGLGNRPGRWDFNSAPNWPYGRRINTFPIWSHQNGQSFPFIIYRNDPTDDPDGCFDQAALGSDYKLCGENDLSHPANNSSREPHYCQPLPSDYPGWDAMTCPTANVGTDKGKISTSAKRTGYPPRADINGLDGDDVTSVNQYKSMNPFDAVSQPTPAAGDLTHAPWLVPQALPAGNYILNVEVAKEYDFNAYYNFPAPMGIPWSDFGRPYRGQPSVLYSVPFTVSDTDVTTATGSDYAGYGDETGSDGNVRPPDQTITIDTPGSGGSRLQLIAEGAQMYRLKVTVNPKAATTFPDMPANLMATDVATSTADMSFTAPGESGERVAGYEVRVRASSEMTADNFEDSMPVTAKVDVNDPGHTTTFQLTSLLPQTDYWVGIRAYDGCHNAGDIAITHILTDERKSGSVDACFIATAAYGSILANDVESLRHFRDSALSTNVLGELGVEAYYTFGPAFAGVIGESDTVRATVRAWLKPIAERVRALGY